MGIRPKKNPSPDSQIAQDVLEQMEMIFQDVRKMPCKPISNTKRTMIKKPMLQNLNRPITFTYYSQTQITKGAKLPLQIFGGLDHIILKRCYRTIIICTNKTSILHRMRLRQFTPHQPIPDISATPHGWQPDPEVTIKHDYLYARAWECEYDEPILGGDYNNLVTPNSPEIIIRSEEVADEMRRTAGTIRENSPKLIAQTDRSYDGTDTNHYMQPDRDTTVEQPDTTPTNPRSSKNDRRHNPKPNCNDDYR